MTSDSTRVRTYGGWRRSRGIGLFDLGTTATFILLGVFTVLLVTVAAWPAGLLWIGPPALLGIAAAFIRVGGIPAGQHAVQRARWWHGTHRGYTAYRADSVVARLGMATLPGMLASTELISAEDGYGGHYGLVRDRRTGYLTATLKVIPASTWLAERDDSDGWVAAWGSWLASLGHIPMIRWVSVTADTAPEPGTALADAVAAAADPRAPKAARDILARLAETAPATAAGVDTRMSLTFDPAASPARPRPLQEAAAEVGRVLHGLQVQLGSCGLTVTGRARTVDIAAAVRVAFDPAARPEASRVIATSADDDPRLAWETAGPGGGRRAVGPVPARGRDLGQLGVAGGAAEQRPLRRPRPADRTDRVAEASDAAIPAAARRVGDKGAGERGPRGGVPPGVRPPHQARRHRPRRDRPRPRPAGRHGRSPGRRRRAGQPVRHHHREPLG
jgi:hypothetical protein